MRALVVLLTCSFRIAPPATRPLPHTLRPLHLQVAHGEGRTSRNHPPFPAPSALPIPPMGRSSPCSPSFPAPSRQDMTPPLRIPRSICPTPSCFYPLVVPPLLPLFPSFARLSWLGQTPRSSPAPVFPPPALPHAPVHSWQRFDQFLPPLPGLAQAVQGEDITSEVKSLMTHMDTNKDAKVWGGRVKGVRGVVGCRYRLLRCGECGRYGGER